MDMFKDYFTAESLMAALPDVTYTPGQIGQLGVFQSMPLAGTVLALESVPDAAVSMPQPSPRGTPGDSRDLPRGRVNTFHTTHYKKSASVIPDEVLNMRNPGSAARQVLEQRRNAKLAVLRRDMDLLHEKLRMDVMTNPAVSTGEDGQSLYGSAGTNQTIAFQTDGTKVRKEMFEKVKKPIETALGGLTYSGIVFVWEDTGWAELIESPYMTKVYLNTPAARTLLEDAGEEMVLWGTRHIRYRGGAGVNIPTGKAIVFPTGVQNLFVQAFAPADTTDQVGSGRLGSPYYVEGRAIDEGKRGYQMDIQTNTVMVCTRPACVFQVGLS